MKRTTAIGLLMSGFLSCPSSTCSEICKFRSSLTMYHALFRQPLRSKHNYCDSPRELLTWKASMGSRTTDLMVDNQPFLNYATLQPKQNDDDFIKPKGTCEATDSDCCILLGNSFLVGFMLLNP